MSIVTCQIHKLLYDDGEVSECPACIRMWAEIDSDKDRLYYQEEARRERETTFTREELADDYSIGEDTFT